jgi:hypothetical protein
MAGTLLQHAFHARIGKGIAKFTKNCDTHLDECGFERDGRGHRVREKRLGSLLLTILRHAYALSAAEF